MVTFWMRIDAFNISGSTRGKFKPEDSVDGRRILTEPPRSDPIPIAAALEETRPASPPELPPGDRLESQGFVAAP